MRTRRILGFGPSCYHVMSRVVDRRFIFNDVEKERFCELMRCLERFSGVEVLTYAIMSNHFHILVRVPNRRELSDEELRDCLNAIYSRKRVAEIMEPISEYRDSGRDDLAESVRQPYLARMFSLACFVKELKQRFTQEYNRKNDRRGTLWEERYRSVLVENSSRALVTIAAYIDLNAVRAGICMDPAVYRHCGYGEAIGGGKRAGWGLHQIFAYGVGGVSPERVLAVYRNYLVYDPGECNPGGSRVKGEHNLTVTDLLRFRIRYFSYGAVLGSRRFVDDLSVRYRERLGRKHHAGAKPMRGGNWNGLHVLRDRLAASQLV